MTYESLSFECPEVTILKATIPITGNGMRPSALLKTVLDTLERGDMRTQMGWDWLSTYNGVRI